MVETTPPDTATRDAAAPDVGVIGGSGLYALLDDADEVEVPTPYGSPSAPVAVGTVGGRRVAFLPRHGRAHEHPPHRVPYRANLWALRELGVRQVLAPYAVGGLRPELVPGTLVVPDQLVDRTTGRVQTYYDDGAVHVPFAEPYCPVGRRALLDADRGAVDGGTVVVVDGPRFSTRAESRWYAAQGWSLVNMTAHPEAVLARELALCFAAVALVTDLDAGLAAGDPTVTQSDVMAAFAAGLDRVRAVVLTAGAALPAARTCPCPRALHGTAAGTAR